jgi:hypothetical protein
MGRGASSVVDRLHAAACLVTANFACRAAVFGAGQLSTDHEQTMDSIGHDTETVQAEQARRFVPSILPPLCLPYRVRVAST